MQQSITVDMEMIYRIIGSQTIAIAQFQQQIAALQQQIEATTSGKVTPIRQPPAEAAGSPPQTDA